MQALTKFVKRAAIPARKPTIWREGDVSVGICPRCKKRVATRFAYRTFELENPRVFVSKVLVGVCQECDEIATVPWQSNEVLRVARERAAAREAKIEARIPGELFETLRVIAAVFHVQDEAFCSLMLRYYLRELALDRRFALHVKRLADGLRRTGGTATERLSLRVPETVRHGALEMAHDVGIDDQTTLVRGIIAAACEDVFGKKGRWQALQALAGAVG